MTAFVATGNHVIGIPKARVYSHAGYVRGNVDLTEYVSVHVDSAAEAREVAQAFIELAGLMEQRERDAAGGEPA